MEVAGLAQAIRQPDEFKNKNKTSLKSPAVLDVSDKTLLSPQNLSLVYVLKN